MTFKGKDLTGETFSRLTIKEFDSFRTMPSRGGRRAFWKCTCVCGNIRVVSGENLRSGNTRSCGCLERELTISRGTKHGHSPLSGGTALYRAWQGMKLRCKSINRRDSKWYSKKGIRVCQRWQRSFVAFLNQMQASWIKGLTLDRKDSDLHYSCGKCAECKRNRWPMNCRWATWSQQRTNRKPLIK